MFQNNCSHKNTRTKRGNLHKEKRQTWPETATYTTLLIREVSEFGDTPGATLAGLFLCFALVFVKHVPQNIVQTEENGYDSFPAIVFYHVGKFNDKFSFFVLLTALKSVFLGKRKS